MENPFEKYENNFKVHLDNYLNELIQHKRDEYCRLCYNKLFNERLNVIYDYNKDMFDITYENIDLSKNNKLYITHFFNINEYYSNRSINSFEEHINFFNQFVGEKETVIKLIRYYIIRYNLNDIKIYSRRQKIKLINL